MITKSREVIGADGALIERRRQSRDGVLAEWAFSSKAALRLPLSGPAAYKP
jgi:hypothetical protein